jgi:spore germination protein KB
LILLLIGFIFGSSGIINSAAGAYQDSWLSYLLAWVGGALLLGLYIWLVKLYPGQTLVGILKEAFGKYLGGLLSLLYIGYFIHLGSLILNNFVEFSVVTLYPETPAWFIAICYILPAVYILLNGFEILARLSELLVPFLPMLVGFLFIILLPRYAINNLFPFLERGIKPVLSSALTTLSFPFGEVVVFLMIFPLLNKQDELVKDSYTALVIVGVILFLITSRDLLTLGPDRFNRSVFPPLVSTRLIPNLDITLSPIIAINLMVGGGIKGTICFYAAAEGIKQVFNLEDYKAVVFPLAVLIMILALWTFDNIVEMMWWGMNIYPLYALPFQVVIPVLILVVTLIKRKFTGR